jgi:hypothetical protein
MTGFDKLDIFDLLVQKMCNGCKTCYDEKTDTYDENQVYFCLQNSVILPEGEPLLDKTSEPAHWYRGERAGSIPCRSFFTIDGGPVVEGYTYRGHWNGWAVPFFNKEQADRVAIAYKGRYLPAQDAYQFSGDGYPLTKDTKDEDTDIFPGEDLVIDGNTLHVYPIGGGCWCWDDEAEQ